MSTVVKIKVFRIYEIFLFFSRGCNVNHIRVGNIRPYLKGTALKMAAQRGCVEVVKVLLEAGANPNITGTFFETTAFETVALLSWPWEAKHFCYTYEKFFLFKNETTMRASLTKCFLQPCSGATGRCQ